MKIFVLVLLFTISGCSFMITKPEVTVKGVRLSCMDEKGVNLEILLTVTNPNSFDLKLTGYRYDLLVSALPLTSDENNAAMEFAGNAATDVMLPVRVSFQDLLQIIGNSPDLNHVPYNLKADLNVRTPLRRIIVPVNKQGVFALPRKYQPENFLKNIKGFFKKDR
jgi:LEA14-like dessication related protein